MEVWFIVCIVPLSELLMGCTYGRQYKVSQFSGAWSYHNCEGRGKNFICSLGSLIGLVTYNNKSVITQLGLLFNFVCCEWEHVKWVPYCHGIAFHVTFLLCEWGRRKPWQGVVLTVLQNLPCLLLASAKIGTNFADIVCIVCSHTQAMGPPPPFC
jgi:hypothetical protein